MRQIRSKDTVPELAVRRLVHAMGYRYRLHVANLPGRPDLVFPRLKRIMELRGCFWHQHPGCIDSHIPKSRAEYWVPKLERNKQRDVENGRALRALGWWLCIVWACETTHTAKLSRRLSRFLAGRHTAGCSGSENAPGAPPPIPVKATR